MDDVDKTDVKSEVLLNATVKEIHRKVTMLDLAIEDALAGECNECNEVMPRLVKGVCCVCRDRLGLA